MSFLSSKSFIFNGINSEDFNVVIAWIDQDEPDVASNGLTREVKKSATNKRKIKDNIYGTENTEPIILKIGLVRIDGTEITRDESMKINAWLTSSPLPQLLKFNDAEILQDKCKVTAAIAKAFAESEFEQYRIIQDKLYQSDFDRLLCDATDDK